ncbi:ATPase domain-containing protein [Halogeometricum limi]|uniref:RecA-superfamily ATPase, KaiC/GvpD/RAD55 family n=1 Tax=Halogeometricum limi TaxID=555875 RepID=A0A1I6I355_9EURY|nr:ATPase domain-containing protein [Halogeometricum limi]SFR61107.1 RecA-superfamily ATPase, KaiC/GvpD/RAD55 family [Halogeometricum limi]
MQVGSSVTETDIGEASTGDTVLDRMLRGGVPRGRAVLVSGGPGAGKSTLGMQFLQTGIEAGEEVLYVSTEQTVDELRDSFGEFAFDLDAPNCHVTSIHAVPGQTIERDDELILSDMEGAESAGENELFSIERPFEIQYIREQLAEYRHCDRIVFDSVSGLTPMAENTPRFRRSLLELIRTFSDEFGAASLLVAEASAEHRDVPAAELLQFTTHGAIQVSREWVAGEYHRYLEIAKMRGVDHDTAPHEFEITRRGIEVLPRDDRRANGVTTPISTGIEGLDRLMGGGYSEGSSTVIEHDGRANLNGTVAAGLLATLEEGRVIVLFPTPNITPEWFREHVGQHVGSMKKLLDEDRLMVVDWSNTWPVEHRNVFNVHLSGLLGLVSKSQLYLTQKLLRIYSTIKERRESPLTAWVYTETMLQDFDASDVRFQYNWARGNIFNPDDNVVFIQNPVSMGEKLAEFYVHDAQQVLRQWVHENGMEYLRLEKGDAGQTDVSCHVSCLQEPPYLEIRGSNASGPE